MALLSPTPIPKPFARVWPWMVAFQWCACTAPPIGPSVERHGDIAAVMTMRDGVKDGPAWLIDRVGNIRKQGRFVHDRKEGIWRTYDRHGRPGEETSYRAGVLQGTCTSFTESGEVVRRVNYDRGVLHGPFETFHPDGTVALQCAYKDGVLNGHYYSYSLTDSMLRGPITECWYDRGAKDGIWTRRYGNGRTSVMGLHRSGIQDGIWRYWDREGRLKRVGYYEMGRRARLVILRRENPWFLLPMG